MEATDSLGLEEQMAEDWAKMDVIENKKDALNQTVKDKQESKAVYLGIMNDADDQIEIWEV